MEGAECESSSPLGGAVVLQALPTLLVGLVWIFLECRHRGPRPPVSARHQGVGLGILAAGCLGYLAWIVFDRLRDCTTLDVDEWRYVCVVGAPVTALLLLLVVGARAVRVGIGLAVALGAASVVADWGLRGSLVDGTDAVAPLLAPVQHLWLLYAAILFVQLPPHSASVAAWRASASASASALSSSSSAMVMVDPLHQQRPTPLVIERGSDRSWSWF